MAMIFSGRQLLLAAGLIFAWPGILSAQWAATRIEHDWQLTVGGSSVGLVQKAVYFVDLTEVNHRETTIYLGPFPSITTRFRAGPIAIAMFAVVGFMAAFPVCRMVARDRDP
jgi:hypothetical protein